MHIKRMHEMIEKLTECAKAEFDNGIENVDTKEMSEVIEMIKNLSCAEKEATITKSMEDYYDEEYRYYNDRRYDNGRYAPKGRGHYVGRRGYMTPDMYHDMNYEDLRDMDRHMGRMYYSPSMRNSHESALQTDGGTLGYNEGYSKGYEDGASKTNARDSREGRSGMSRKRYYEAREQHNGNSQEDKQQKMRKLDTYLNDIKEDLKEMVQGMSQEEKTMMKQKLENIASTM